jgi:leader peptidase (prepilin peptidase)/N-methyltransferase
VHILLMAVVGLAWGAAAVRFAARWPAHPDGAIRDVDWRTPAVALAGGASFAALAWRWPALESLLPLAIYAAALIVLLATDLDQKLLPDAITLPLIPYALVLVVLGRDPLLAGKDLALVSALVAAVGAPALLLVSDRLFRGALGMGDVKLSVSLGLMCGITRLFAGFLLASIASSVVLLALIAMRKLTLRSAIPFGPILICGGILAALLP